MVAPAAKTEQVEALDQKVRILERRWELDQEQATAKAKETRRWLLPGKRVSHSEPQIIAFNYAFVDTPKPMDASSLMTRSVRSPIRFCCAGCALSSEGTVGKYFDFRIMTDFGGGTATVQDAYLDIRPWSWGKLPRRKIQASSWS